MVEFTKDKRQDTVTIKDGIYKLTFKLSDFKRMATGYTDGVFNTRYNNDQWHVSLNNLTRNDIVHIRRKGTSIKFNLNQIPKGILK